jgi:hypothetical protein
LIRRVEAVLVEGRADWPEVIVLFEPLRGDRTPIEDRIRLEPRGELSAIEGVGRILRILRAARVRAPDDLYELADGPEKLTALLNRCVGARIVLQVAQRIERLLTVWTETGVERIEGVVDFSEDAEGLSVRRKGGQSVLRIPRGSLIRFASSSVPHPVVVSVEVPAR